MNWRDEALASASTRLPKDQNGVVHAPEQWATDGQLQLLIDSAEGTSKAECTASGQEKCELMDPTCRRVGFCRRPYAVKIAPIVL